MGDLRADTNPTRIENRSYAVTISEDWEIWGPNGGYTSALLLRAVGAHTDKQQPVSFAGQYLKVPTFGEAIVAIDRVKQSRDLAAYHARLLQDGVVHLQALIWVGNVGDGPKHQIVTRPDCYVPLAEAGPRPPVGPFPFWDRMEIRQVKNSAGYYSHWYRFVPDFLLDDPFIDGARILVLIDSMQWPARYFMEAQPPMYVAPSLDLHVHFHRFAPNSRWLFNDAVSAVAESGLVAGRSTVWDDSGRLLASGGGQSIMRPVATPY